MRQPIPKSMRFRVLSRDGFRCRYCGASPPDVVLHLDHVLAVANGGQNTDDNLVAACLPCNIGKGTSDATPPVFEIVGGVEFTHPVKPRPKVEFFWARDYSEKAGAVVDARCIEFPGNPEETHPWEWEEFNWYWHGRRNGLHYSSHGASTRGFSPYEAAMYATEILAMRWMSHRAYFLFIDDLLEHVNECRIPQYIAPQVLRGLHPEVVTERCGTLKWEQEEITDHIAKQAAATFKPFLDLEHAPWSGRNCR